MHWRRERLAILACMVWLAACSHKQAAPSAPATADDAEAVDPADIPAPGGIPRDVFAAVLVRSPLRVGSLIAMNLVLPSSDERLRSQLAEVLALLEARLGVDPLAVRSMSGFMTVAADGTPMSAAIVPDVRGTPRLAATGEHAGVSLYALADVELVLALRGTDLVLGTEAGVRAALDVLAGAAPALGDDTPLGRQFAALSDGAWFALAADAAGLPAPEAVAFLAGQGVQGAAVSLSPRSLGLRVRGDDARLRALVAQLELVLSMAVNQLASAKQQAVAGGSTIDALGAIATYHQAAYFAQLARPTVTDGEATLDLEVASSAMAGYVAVVGVLTAIALPAFMKYIKTSKTTEARAFVRSIHDGAREHYLQHGTLPPSAPLAPGDPTECCERCAPNAALWTAPGWVAVGFSIDEPHYYSYELVSDGTGFTARAMGDLDCDGVYSTFEMYGAADKSRLPADAGIYREQELE